jgi:hypothetical protein
MKITIKTIYGKVIFEHKTKDNTIKKTVLEALKKGANLYGANLSGADLSGADLYGANLSGADLSGADLSGALNIPIYCKWSFGLTDDLIHIGCEKRSAKDWEKFLGSDEVIETPRDSKEFKQIQAVIRACIAYQKVLNS